MNKLDIAELKLLSINLISNSDTDKPVFNGLNCSQQEERNTDIFGKLVISKGFQIDAYISEIESVTNPGVIKPDKTKVYEPRAPPPSTATANRSKLKLS